jgi:hypothetical protein
MDKNKIVKWAPRILSILFIIFISLFALDVFAEFSFWKAILAFVIHLIPSYILILALILAWKRPFLGALSYFLIAIFFTVFFNTYSDLIVFFLISGPPLLLGILYLLSYYSSKSS